MKILLFYLLLIIPLPVYAIDFNFNLTADYYGDLEPTTPYDNLRIRFYARPEISGELFNGNLDYFVSINLYYQPIGDEMIVRPDNILRECYFGLHGNFYDLYLGQRFVNWGKVDFYSPVNVINAINTTSLSLDNVEEGRLPDLMADLQIFIGANASLELIYVPFPRPFFHPDEEVNVTIDFLYLDIDAVFKHAMISYLTEPAHSLFTSFRYWSYWFDILLSYSYFVDQYPDFDLSGITQEIDYSGFYNKYIIRGIANNTYNRAHLLGLGISTNIKSWGFDAESGLKITEDWDGSRVEIKNSELVSNLQVNKTFFDHWFFQANFIHRYIINHKAALQSELNSRLLSYIETEMEKHFLQPVESQIYMAAHLHRYALHNTLYFALNGGIGFAIYPEEEYEMEVYLAPRAAYHFSDLVKIEAGGDFYLQGEEAGYLGRNKYKDNFYIRFILRL